MEAGHRRGHRHPVPADRHGGGHHPAVRLQAERATPRNPREGRKADQPRQQEGPDLHRLFGHGGIPVRARERHGENAAGTQHGPHHGGGRRQDDDSGVQGRDEPRPDLLLPEVQGQGRAVPQGHGGHRHPDRDGLHLRGAEPAGLRLLHQLRHPLEPRAHPSSASDESTASAAATRRSSSSTSGPTSTWTNISSSSHASRKGCVSPS